LPFFLRRPKKKGEKEGRPSAGGRFFRERPQGKTTSVIALRPLEANKYNVAGRNNA